jgi:hypothetical protein
VRITAAWLRLVLGEGARLIGLGLLIGVPATYAAGRALSGALVGVSPYDPLTLTTDAIGLAVVALAVCYLTCRRGACPASSRPHRCATTPREGGRRSTTGTLMLAGDVRHLSSCGPLPVLVAAPCRRATVRPSCCFAPQSAC